MSRIKNVKKNVLALACLCTLFLVGGVATVNAKAGEGDATPAITTLQMIPGAGIRTGEANEVTGEMKNANGIRFSAEIDASEYEALEGEITAGTFIMPYDYTSYAPLNAENCFTGARHPYTWEGKTATTDTTDEAYEILHVPANISATPNKSEITKNKEVYRINGSVVNMLDENLDRKYIGVSYIKVGDEYYFAEAKKENSRSMMTVAQNILASTNPDAEKDKLTAEEYANQYLEYKGTVTVTVKQETWVNSSAGYTKEATTDLITQTLTTADDFARTVSVQEKTGYQLVTGLGYATESVLRVDETVTLVGYYDKIVANTVLFDGSKATGDQDVFEANGMTNPNSNLLYASDAWGYHGGKSIVLNDWSNTWAGMAYDTPVTLPAPTNKISFMIRTNDTYGVQSQYPNILEIYYGESQYHAVAFRLPEGLGEVAQITLTLPAEISSVYRYSFKCDDSVQKEITLTDSQYGGGFAGTYGSTSTARGDNNPFYIDYIQAEYDLINTLESSGNIIATQANETKTVDLSGLSSTIYSDAEIAGATTISVKNLATSTVENPTLTDGKFDLTIAGNSSYRVEYSVNVGATTVSNGFYALGYYSDIIMNFEDDGTIGNTSVSRITDTGIDGKAFDIYAGAWNTSNTGTSYTLDTSYTLTSDITKICFWLYWNGDATYAKIDEETGKATIEGGSAYTYFTIYHDGQWGRTNVFFNGLSLETGWNYFEIDIGSIAAGKTITKIEIPVHRTDKSADGSPIWYYIWDRIALR